MTTFGGFKDAVRGIAKIAGYSAAAASFGYAIVFAIKNAKNGKPIHVNLIAGFIHGIGQTLHSVLSVVSTNK